jgi:hypothetical protein
MLAFRRLVEANDLDRVGELLTESVVLNSPVAFRPYQGRETVATIITVVATVFEDFTYEREISAPSDHYHALMFRARVGDMSIQGCDFVHTDAEGLIDELTVMLRPLRAVHAFAEQMSSRIATATTAASEASPSPPS